MAGLNPAVTTLKTDFLLSCPAASGNGYWIFFLKIKDFILT
jgi:hypothetical protein